MAAPSQTLALPWYGRRDSVRKRLTVAKVSPRVLHLRTTLAPSLGSFASTKTTTAFHQARSRGCRYSPQGRH